MLGGNHLYNCKYCADNPYFYTALGHYGKPNGAWEQNIVTGREFEKCPKLTLLEADPAHIAEINVHRDELYPLYRAGHLPRSGGVYDQDARTLDYFRVIDEMRDGAEAAHIKILREDGATSNGDGDPGLS